jgi:DNA polymerase-3 subunit beta
MHVIVNRNALAEVLAVASGIVTSRTTKEILRCVRLTAANDELLVSATDLEVALRVGVRQVELKEEGDLVVPADKLMSIARESQADTLTLESDEQNCHLRTEDSHFEVYGQDPKEFPPVADLEGEPTVELETDVLRKLIERTAFSVAKENTRYAINGVMWEKKGKKMALVATDGRRLARAEGAAEEAAGEDGTMIVPAKTVNVMQRVLGHSEGNVAVKFSENQVVVKSDGYVLSSALVEGQFPNYEEVIPRDNDKTIKLPTGEFTSAVRRAALLTNEQSKGIRLSFSKGKLVLSSRAAEQGEATVSMKVDYSGESFEIGFNPTFLIDALRVVGEPEIRLELKEANRPGVLKAGEGFMYVIMPVNLS